jgi:hypothetical protein
VVNADWKEGAAGGSPVADRAERRLPRRSNIVWAPIKDGLDGISLSANWMWAEKKVKMLVYTQL